MAKAELVRPERVTGKFSRVLETSATDSEIARVYFQNKLEHETDPSDVHSDLENGLDGFVIVDARSKLDFEEQHIPSAINIPYRSISPETTLSLPKNKILVLYCWGPGCNASTKAAVRFSELGYRVKEMIGGIEYWRREGYKLEGTKTKDTLRL